ncbi:MAG: hypothetical protein A2452_11395 [Candidatus Firestonebacteria bacterium RIFOXYC2_FULL_39_67]|nr:MAG: hypothetical protein A2536_09960 [Candidatus Firestonebacteria bacterium RIFOXYD2_FULL_39_29]OGF54550.1 MAG: hypothetical protein A2452_11395 [Candidatus Firestonebacteria bacterium RIFOXYC2_FULL_39_67]
MGIAHPPGYPLYNLLGNFFIHIMPCSTIAFRVNLFSAFFASLASGLIFQTIKRLTKSSIISLTTALFFAFSPLIWKYAVLAEVFALNSFFAALLCYIAVRWEEETSQSKFLLFVFIFGAALAHHQTMLFVFPAAVFLFFTQIKKPKSWVPAIILFITGLAFYLYLPLRAAAAPEINWFNPQTWEGFKKIVLRTIYGSPALNLSQLSYFNNSPFYHYLKELFYGFFILGAFIGLLGFYRQIRKGLWFFFIAFFFTGPVFILFTKYDNNPIYFNIISRFYPLSFIFLAAGIGTGLHSLSQYLSKKALLLLPLLSLLPLLFNYSRCDLSKNLFLDNFCKAALYSSGEKQAILVVTGDSTIMGFDYLQMVEQKKRETKIFSLEKLSHKWYVDQLKITNPSIIFPFERIQINETLESFITANEREYDFHAIGITNERLGKTYRQIPSIIGAHLKKQEAKFEKYSDSIRYIESKVSILDLTLHSKENDFEKELHTYIVRAYTGTGSEFQVANDNTNALIYYNRALSLDPSFYGAWKNMGVLYYTLGKNKEANNAFRNFLKYAPSDEKDRKTIENIVKQ